MKKELYLWILGKRGKDMGSIMEKTIKDDVREVALRITKTCGNILITSREIPSDDMLNISQSAKIWMDIYKEVKGD